jgi:hypothetical protein
MSIRPRPTGALHYNAAPSLAEEVRGLRKLAKDRRAASLVLFRTNAKRPTLPRIDVRRTGRERIAA